MMGYYIRSVPTTMGEGSVPFGMFGSVVMTRAWFRFRMFAEPRFKQRMRPCTMSKPMPDRRDNERKSECCGADLYEALWWGTGLWKCSKCHRPVAGSGRVMKILPPKNLRYKHVRTCCTCKYGDHTGDGTFLCARDEDTGWDSGDGLEHEHVCDRWVRRP